MSGAVAAANGSPESATRRTGTAWAMLSMQVRVEQRLFWRNLSSVVFTFVLPLIVLLALWLGDDPAANVPYIVALAVLSTGFQGLGIQLVMHRDQGVLKGLMSTPLPPWALIAGKAISVATVALVESLLVVALAALLFDASMPQHFVALAAVVVLGTVCCAALAFALASLITSSDAAPAVANGVYLVMLMATVLLRSVDGIPHWLRAAGEALPFTALVDLVDHAWMGAASGRPWLDVVVLAAWAVAGATWTTRRFHWDPAATT